MTATPDQQNPVQRISELESVRGIAALLVVFFHIPRWNPALYDVAVIRNGYLMVELFFVLSGFVIHRAYSSRLSNFSELARFQFLRFSRLYPVHLLFLAFFVLVEIGKYLAAGKMSVNSAAFGENSVTALVQHLFLVQAVGPTGNSFTFNVPSWSISVEFYTYLLFGLVVLCARRAQTVVFVLLAMFSLAAIMNQSMGGFDDLLHCIAGFFIGCLTAHLTTRLKLRLPSYAPLLAAAGITGFLYVKTTKVYDPLVFLLSAAIVMSIVYAGDGFAKRLLNSRPLHRLGTISYSVYMCHSAVLWVFSFVVGKVLERPEIVFKGKNVPQLALGETLICYGLIVLVVLVLSNLVYEWIEKPIRERSRRVVF